MTDTTLYDTDFVAWTEEQAAALRTLAQQPDLTNAVDWGNIIEEIECLGRSEARGVESQLVNALAHILKGFCDPGSLARLAWAIETGNFLQQARKDFRRSMRDKLSIDEIWREAFQSASRELLAYKRRVPPPEFPRPPRLPWTRSSPTPLPMNLPFAASTSSSTRGIDLEIEG